MILKKIFRLNHIRNHYLRFGLKGIMFYFKTLLSKKDFLVFSHKEFQQNVYLRKKSSDIATFYQVLFNLEYQLTIKEEPSVIIDLGANIGLASVFFLNKYPNSIVIAVEPEKSNFDCLLKNTKEYTNIIAYNNGIWNKNANLEIKSSELGSWAFYVNEVEKEIPNSVKAISINQIIENHSLKQIDILKIDIEGSEIELFSSNYETWLPITRMIIIELHDWMREGCAKQFFTTLVKYNFQLSHKGENLICYLKNK